MNHNRQQIVWRQDKISMNTPAIQNGKLPSYKVGPRKRFDPQIIVEGNLQHGPTSDYIKFKLRLLIVDLTFIVALPPEGETKAPVYVKFHIDWSQHQPPGSVAIQG